jgi:uncharacterized membrane protein
MFPNAYIPQCTPEAQSRRPLVAWGVAAAFVLALVALIVAAPLFLAHGDEPLARGIYHSFSSVCHQIPERAFHLAGHPLAVCARCTGLYLGLAAGILLFPLVRPLRTTATPARFWLFVAAAPTVIDFSLGFLGVWQNTHLSRFVTGALLGAVAALFIVPGIVDLGRMSFRRGRVGHDAAERLPATARNIAAPGPGAPSDYSRPASRI